VTAGGYFDYMIYSEVPEYRPKVDRWTDLIWTWVMKWNRKSWNCWIQGEGNEKTKRTATWYYSIRNQTLRSFSFNTSMNVSLGIYPGKDPGKYFECIYLKVFTFSLLANLRNFTQFWENSNQNG